MTRRPKYELTDIIIKHNGALLTRIRALRTFEIRGTKVSKGALGGFVGSEINLAQEGNAWIFDDAKVWENARVRDNALVAGSAEVYGYALICDDAYILNRAKVFQKACVKGKAQVSRNASIQGTAILDEEAQVSDHATVTGDARVFGDARILNYATIKGEAQVRGNAIVKHHAVVGQEQLLTNCVCSSDLTQDLAESLRCQTGLLPINGKVILYKQVRKDLRSFFDWRFIYTVGAEAEALQVIMNHKACASGLHASHANYWNEAQEPRTSTFLAIEVALEDIITIQAGKVRFKKGVVLGRYDIAPIGESK